MTRGTHELLDDGKLAKTIKIMQASLLLHFANVGPTHFVARGARQSCFSETFLSLLKSVVFCGKVLPYLITLTARKLLLIQIKLTLLNSVSLLLDIATFLSASVKFCCPGRVFHSHLQIKTQSLT